MTTISGNIGRGKDGEGVTGRLGGWGGSSVINPAGTQAPDPQGQSSFTVQCQISPPGVFTVEFEIGDQTTSSGNPPNKPTAEITASTNGNNVRRVVSIVNGLALSIVAEYVKVKVFDATTEEDTTTLPYTAQVLITPGTRAGYVQPLYQNIDSVELPAAGMGGPGTVDVTIPQDIGAVTYRALVWDEAETGTTDMSKVLIMQQNSAGSTIAGVQDPNETNFVHLVPQAAILHFVNLNSNKLRVFVQFGVQG